MGLIVRVKEHVQRFGALFLRREAQIRLIGSRLRQPGRTVGGIVPVAFTGQAHGETLYLEQLVGLVHRRAQIGVGGRVFHQIVDLVQGAVAPAGDVRLFKEQLRTGQVSRDDKSARLRGKIVRSRLHVRGGLLGRYVLLGRLPHAGIAADGIPRGEEQHNGHRGDQHSRHRVKADQRDAVPPLPVLLAPVVHVIPS